jgi:hypothetical protein
MGCGTALLEVRDGQMGDVAAAGAFVPSRLMADNGWLVPVRGSMTDGKRARSQPPCSRSLADHGGRFAGPDGKLPEITSHTLRVHVGTAAEAVERVRQMAEPHSPFVESEPRPAGELGRQRLAFVFRS